MSAIRFGTGQPRRFATHVRFVLDAQLPPALARALREAGYDVRAVRELGLRDAGDSEIWDYALANQAAIVTKDQDLPNV